MTDNIDMQRIRNIVARVIEQKGEAAVSGWQPSPMDQLQTELYNTLHQEYPELDLSVQPRISGDYQVKENDPFVVEIDIERVEKVGEFKISF